MNLKDLPEGTIPDWLRTAIEQDLLREVRNEAESRKNSVARGAETPELSATLLDKFGWGLSKAARIIGFDATFQTEVDRLVREIDPQFEENRKARWAARPASIGF